MVQRTGGAARSAAAVAMVLGLAATGCGGGEGSGSPEIRYSWWGNAERAELMREAIALFEEEHPDIAVTPTFSEYDTYWEKLSTQVAGGGMPDVLQMDNAYLREYSDRGVLLDLEAHEQNLDTSGLLEGLSTAGVVDGARYGVPVGGNTFSLVYAPELFEEAGAPMPEDGWTWEDYDEALTAVSEHTGGDPYGASDYTGLIWVLEAKLRQEGDALFTDGGKLGFGEDRLAEFWESAAGLREDGAVVPADEAEQVKPLAPLGANLSASEFTWDNMLTRYVEESDLDLELAPLPTDSGDSGQYLKPSMLLSASAQTSNPGAAAKLVDFMINDPRVAEIFGGNRGIPATEAQREAIDYTEVDQAIVDYEEDRMSDLQEAPPAPPAGAGALETEFIRLSEEVHHGQMSPDEAAGEFADFAERTLSS
ncbi:ABC transporter substrate-binding protein [Streptomonospora wellingtoniae]|uniref:Extracellular solute-binding protein n=1 Tax=Streptomonospora wellingtoniae TaxID=3075544 RepID=A0ABU2KUK3_9ACTN|nr:extracellular solute-binding protein [Streptomonospora sp. DSM 45055]MDT0302976.1 extracellular solute-binding protein [Streptomonospora sp. DSM 45055]